MADEQLVQDLKTARKLIKKGWTQRNSISRQADGTMSYCALGACWAASGYNFDIASAVAPRAEAAVAALRTAIPKRFAVASTAMSVIKFNDDGSTTHKDVLKLFKKAIKAAEGD